jgi:hypothetical protein
MYQICTLFTIGINYFFPSAFEVLYTASRNLDQLFTMSTAYFHYFFFISSRVAEPETDPELKSRY